MSPEMLPLRLRRWWSYLNWAGKTFGVDPYDLAAVMDRESLGGEALSPKGAGGTGDFGHGRGLMQIDDRAWPAFVAAVGPNGEPLWKSPRWNILFGAQLISDNLVRFRGNRLAAFAAYNAGPGKVASVLGQLPDDWEHSSQLDLIQALDRVTTGGNYVSDVVKRREKFGHVVGETF